MSRGRRLAAILSLSGAVAVLLLKLAAYALTGSVSLLSDAAESLVNVTAAAALLLALRLAHAPADYEHPYGHQKAEYLSSAFEAALILVAAGMILYAALQRLFDPQPLERVGVGVTVALLAAALNAALSVALRLIARRVESAAIRANARHLLTDVWSSLGVVASVVLVGVTGWQVLDPLAATVVALHIAREGYRVMTGSLSSLMDMRLPDDEEAVILRELDRHPRVLGYHRLRSRKSGNARFAEFDVFVDPDMTVDEAHELVAEVEDKVHELLPNLVTTIHVEPFVEGRREGAVTPRQEFEES